MHIDMHSVEVRGVILISRWEDLSEAFDVMHDGALIGDVTVRKRGIVAAKTKRT